MKSLSILILHGLFFSALAWLDEAQSTVRVTVTTDIYTTVCPLVPETSYRIETSNKPIALSTTDTGSTYTISQTFEPPKLIAPTIKSSSQNTSPITEPLAPYVTPVPLLNSTFVPRVWITITETLSKLTTFCPSPTQFVQNSKIYTVTEPTTMTISDCPCTISRVLPATVKTFTTSALTTYFDSTTTIYLSGITIPVLSTGSTTIPFVKISTIPVSATFSTFKPPQLLSSPTISLPEKTSSQLLSLPTISLPEKTSSQLSITTINSNIKPTTSSEPNKVNSNSAARVNARIFAVFAASLATNFLLLG